MKTAASARSTRSDLLDDRYAALHESFRWQVPDRFNIAEACMGRWARETPASVALVHEDAKGRIHKHSYAELHGAANRLSNALRDLKIERGDRVAVVLPQRFETAVADMAVLQLGAIAAPLSVLFGPEALAYRLSHSGTQLAIVDEAGLANLRSARGEATALRSVVVIGNQTLNAGELAWDDLLAAHADHFEPVDTASDDAAILIYTSGTTGPPKGALLPHRALIGNLPGFVASHNWFGHAGDEASRGTFWSPADWAWTGGLMDALLPTLYFGRTLLGSAGRFAPERAFELMVRHRVTHTFLFPTALKAMMKAVPRPRERYALDLQAVMSAGEAVGSAVFDWCRRELGVTVNEMFGQTEINYVVGNCGLTLDAQGRPAAGWPARPGSMGRPYPGHRIAVIGDDGLELPRGTPGDVAVHRRDVHGDLDPIFFLGYWNDSAATRAKFTGDPLNAWCRTGDTATMDDDGYLWYQGRSDDVFKSAGYRIGPAEIENCLLGHAAVANAAVVPKPDAERGALVKAYVVLAAGHGASDALVAELQSHVRDRLAPYEYPKEIEFIAELPMTTTGKVQRRVLRLLEEERARA